MLLLYYCNLYVAVNTSPIFAKFCFLPYYCVITQLLHHLVQSETKNCKRQQFIQPKNGSTTIPHCIIIIALAHRLACGAYIFIYNTVDVAYDVGGSQNIGLRRHGHSKNVVCRFTFTASHSPVSQAGPKPSSRHHY